jgi:hypothetical protein
LAFGGRIRQGKFLTLSAELHRGHARCFCCSRWRYHDSRRAGSGGGDRCGCRFCVVAVEGLLKLVTVAACSDSYCCLVHSLGIANAHAIPPRILCKSRDRKEMQVMSFCIFGARGPSADRDTVRAAGLLPGPSSDAMPQKLYLAVVTAHFQTRSSNVESSRQHCQEHLLQSRNLVHIGP